ncbi:MAG: carbon storage regulator CsrA [Firmicutes bacterium]|nr:carbon storage regulator CsrA [Bacillota bacterium]
MLVLTRRKNESILVGDNIRITVLDVRDDAVRIGIEAPREVTILRAELYQAVREENVAASRPDRDTLRQLEGLLEGGKEKEPAEGGNGS